MPLPGPLRLFGRKHAELAGQWIGSAGAYGGAAGMAVLYFTDWKAVLQYMPYYNGKWTEEK